MFQISLYPIAANLWRWEVRYGSTLVRCGTAPSRNAAANDVKDLARY
jgi:hypothetical protein